MKILIIDNNIDRDSWGSADLRRLCQAALAAKEAEAGGATCHVRRAPHGDLPKSPEGFDRIVVSGSKTGATDDAPWIDRLLEFMRQCLDRKKPLLGVCYGHQMLARALGDKNAVRRAAKPEFGWSRIDIVEASPLLLGLPKSFYSFSSHYDEVARLPAGLRRLARSEICEVQACDLPGHPVFGIQFHPEKNADEAEKIFAERRKLKEPEELLGAGATEKLYDPKVGTTIFRNFFSL
jgi:GMP synthase-like glutamine amidotransferase